MSIIALLFQKYYEGENCSLNSFRMDAFCSLIGHFVPYVNQNYYEKVRISYEISDLLNNLLAGMVIAIKDRKIRRVIRRKRGF